LEFRKDEGARRETEESFYSVKEAFDGSYNSAISGG